MGILKVQIRRAFRSKTLPYVALVSLFAMAACHVWVCLGFWGHDMGELPDASAMWAGNYQTTGSMFVCFFVTYLAPPLSSAIYGDNLYRDIRTHSAHYQVTRASLGSYVVAGAVAAFLVSFVTFFLVYMSSLLMALLAFPVQTGWESYRILATSAVTNREGLDVVRGMPFGGLCLANRYLYDLTYCAYDALWAAIMALASYVTSLFTHGNRLVVVGLPTLVFLVSWLVVPSGYNVVVLLLPTVLDSVSMSAFVLTPIFAMALLALLAATKLRFDKDILL